MKRRWCSGIMQDSHSCDPGSIPGRRNYLFFDYIFSVNTFDFYGRYCAIQLFRMSFVAIRKRQNI